MKWFSILAVSLTACGASKESSVILPGVLDIKVVEESQIPKDCKTSELFEKILKPIFEETLGASTCVLLKPEKDDSFEGDGTRDWTTIYTDILGEDGWRFVQPFGTSYLLQRPIKNSECAEQVLFTWWPYGDYETALVSVQENNGADFDYATFTFTHITENACRDERLFSE